MVGETTSSYKDENDTEAPVSNSNIDSNTANIIQKSEIRI